MFSPISSSNPQSSPPYLRDQTLVPNRSENILTGGGFIKFKKFSIKGQFGDEKIRLYHLPDTEQKTIELVREAIINAEWQKDRSYLGKKSQFYAEAKDSPYLLRRGNTLQLISKADVDIINDQQIPNSVKFNDSLFFNDVNITDPNVLDKDKLKFLIRNRQALNGIEACVFFNIGIDQKSPRIFWLLKSLARNKAPIPKQVINHLVKTASSVYNPCPSVLGVLLEISQMSSAELVIDGLVGFCSSREAEGVRDFIDWEEQIRKTASGMKSNRLGLGPVTEEMVNKKAKLLSTITQKGINNPNAKKMALRGLINYLLSKEVGDDTKLCVAEAIGTTANEKTLDTLNNHLTSKEVDDDIKKYVIEAISAAVQAETPIAKELLDRLIIYLLDQSKDGGTQYDIVDALSSIIQRKTSLAIKALEALFEYIKQNDSEEKTTVVNNGCFFLQHSSNYKGAAKKTAVEALGTAAKGENPLFEEALDKLICLINQNTDSIIRGYAAEALYKAAQEGTPFLGKNLENLFGYLKSLPADSRGDSCIDNVAKTIGEIAQRGTPIPGGVQEVLIRFIHINVVVKSLGQIAQGGTLIEVAQKALIDDVFVKSSDGDMKIIAMEALGKIAQSGALLPEKVTKEIFEYFLKPRDQERDSMIESRRPRVWGQESLNEDERERVAIEVIGKIAERGTPLTEKVISKLIDCLQDSRSTEISARALASAIQSSPKKTKTTETAFIKLETCLKNESNGIALHLGKIVQGKGPFSKEALNTLISCFLSIDSLRLEVEISETLAKVSKSEISLPQEEEIINKLVSIILKKRFPPYLIRSIADSLSKISQEGSRLTEKAKEEIKNCDCGRSERPELNQYILEVLFLRDLNGGALKMLETKYPEVAVGLTLCSKSKERGVDVSLAFEEQMSMLPMDIKNDLKSQYGEDLLNQLVKIVNDIVKEQGTIHIGGDEKAQKFNAPPKVIRNNGEGLRCGYYAMAAGILQLSPEQQNRIFRRIGYQQQLTGNINQDQYSVGDQLFRYSIQHREIFVGALHMFVNTMVAAFYDQRNIDILGQYDINELNNTIIQIQDDVGAGINIYADRIQILGIHIGISCYINGEMYGVEALVDAPRIDIYNPQGGHYECFDMSR